MLVEQPASNQLALHLAKLLTDLPSLGSVLALPLKLVLGELPMSKVCRRDPRSTLLGLCTSAGPTMEAAAAILLICRTLTRGAPAGLRTAPLPWPVRSEPPLDTDVHIVFCQHVFYPAYGVLLYHEIGLPSRHMKPSNKGKYPGFTGRGHRLWVLCLIYISIQIL